MKDNFHITDPHDLKPSSIGTLFFSFFPSFLCIIIHYSFFYASITTNGREICSEEKEKRKQQLRKEVKWDGKTKYMPPEVERERTKKRRGEDEDNNVINIEWCLCREEYQQQRKRRNGEQ